MLVFCSSKTWTICFVQLLQCICTQQAGGRSSWDLSVSRTASLTFELQCINCEEEACNVTYLLVNSCVEKI